jgi:glycosyltransferase involved in cell wall biosynthesis
MNVKKVMVLVREFPQLSQTYIQAEVEALAKYYDVLVVAKRKPETLREKSPPFRICPTDADVLATARDFKPDVLHGHWLFMAPRLHKFSLELGIPFTLRAHSFDTLARENRGRIRKLYRSFRNSSYENRTRPWTRYVTRKPWSFRTDFHVTEFVKASRDESCMGVLSMPFARKRLLLAGTPEDKLIDSPPVVDFARFHDEGPNGPDVIHVGAALTKKGMDDFMRLSKMVPNREFNVYPIGYSSQKIRELNDRMGRPVNFKPTVQLEEMPSIYKKHQPIAYTAKKDSSVGWPVSLAEAQAAGLGAVINGIRPDLADYVGDGGLVYSSLEEASEFLKRPYTGESRRKGFEWARHSDIRAHVHLLSLIWQGKASQLSGRKWNSPVPGNAQDA